MVSKGGWGEWYWVWDRGRFGNMGEAMGTQVGVVEGQYEHHEVRYMLPYDSYIVDQARNK